MIKNIAIRFDPAEDRLVISVTVRGPDGLDSTYLLHLTRRLVRTWRRDLQAMVDLSAATPQPLDAAAKAQISRSHHAAMAGQAQTRHEPAPAPDAFEPPPDLVTRIVCGRRRKDGRWVMNFERRNAPAINLVLSSPTLHALIDGVNRRVAVADWGMAPLPLEATPSPNPPDRGTPLH